MMTSMNLRRLTLLLFFTFSPFYFFTFTSARSIQTINADRAREVAREQIVWNGRLCTFSTFALDFLRSVYEEPMIRIPDENLRAQLHIKGEYAKFAELFDDTLGYKLNSLGADLPERLRQMARETPAAISLDEKVGQIILLTKGELFQPRPADMKPLPAWRVEVEIFWNNTPWWVLLILIAVVIAIGLEVLRWRKKWLAYGSSCRHCSCCE